MDFRILNKITAFIGILAFCSVHAQDPFYVNKSVDNGLPDNHIYNIVQDNSGYMWAGSDGGLFRYDGIRSAIYSNPGQRSKAITGLTISAAGKLYAYNFAGQFFCVDTTLKIIPCPQVNINGICADSLGNIWVTGNDGIFSYNEKTSSWDMQPVLNGLLKKTGEMVTRNCIIDSNGSLWFTAFNVVHTWRNGELITHEIHYRKEDNHNVNDYMLHVSRFGAWLFSITDGAPYVVEGNHFEPMNSDFLITNLKGRKLTNILSTGADLIITTYSGVVTYLTDKFTGSIWYTDFAFSDALIDNEGNQWLSSLYSGLFRIPDPRFIWWKPSAAEFFRAHSTRLCVTGDETYFATENGGLVYVDRSTHAQVSISRNVRADIQFLNYDSLDDRIYLGYNNKIGFADHEKVNDVGAIFLSPKDMLHLSNGYYVACPSGTYFVKTLEVKSPMDTLTTNYSRDILREPGVRQHIWLATNSGVALFADGPLCMHNPVKVLCDSMQFISLTYSSVSGDVYALTALGQIWKMNFQKDPVLCVKEIAGVQRREICAVQGKIYCATNRGLEEIDPLTGKVFVVDNTIGLFTNDILGVDFHSGSLFVSGGAGVMEIPIDFQLSSSLPSIRLNGILVNGEVALPNAEGQYVLPSKSSLEITADIIGYSSDGRYKYAYRFSGTDTAWRYIPVSEGSLVFPSFPPGDFQLEIRAVDHFGKFSREAIYCSGNVMPPFWQRWWFYVAIALTVILISFLIFRYRLRIINRKQQLVLHQLKLENEVRLSQQRALTSQMNPHFIFNVLNSIKAFIYEGDRSQAIHYLDSFSDMVRNVLGMSTRLNVTLEEEIAVLKVYIDLESMLIPDKFTLSIDTAPELDTSSVLVPALLIQPFVENAFKHGLRHKEGPKCLSIRFSWNKEMQILTIVVTDNGVGRKRAEEINVGRMRKHASFATNAAEQRIGLVDRDSKNPEPVVIEDLYDDEQNPIGTRVTLTIVSPMKKTE